MAQLRDAYSQFVGRSARVIVIGPEGPERFMEYFSRESLPFIGLPDPEHTVLKLYGQELSIFKLGRMPAQVLVDRGGLARLVHYGHSMRDIPEPGEVLVALDALGDDGVPQDGA